MKNRRLIRILYFTDNGRAVTKKLEQSLKDYYSFQIKPMDTSVDEFVSKSFRLNLPLVFVSATGIAVRAIAKYVDNKLLDSPVIVIDEHGKNIIPVLSGHYGGANEMSKLMAEEIGASAIITTATDLNNVFAVDVFARNNGFRILDKSKIKEISSKLLKEERIFYKNDIEDLKFIDEAPENLLECQNIDEADILFTEDVDTNFRGLVLVPKRLVLGMGCKKDKDFNELLDFVKESYREDYLRDNLFAISTIDVKEEETGLLILSSYLGCKFIVSSADELGAVKGDFEESAFVKDTVGVGNVSERSAMCLGGQLIKGKEAKNGMTKAFGIRDLRSVKWQEKSI